MKKVINLKSLLVAIGILITSLTTLLEAAELKNGQYIYINYGTSTWGSSSAKFKFNWYWNVGDYCCENQETGRVSGENYAYATTQNEYTRAVQILRFNSDYSTQWNYTTTVAVSDNSKNCISLTAAVSNNYSFSWTTYAPPMSTTTLSDNGTSIVSGSGTSGDPYLVYVGAKIKVSASGTKAVADPDATVYYDFKQSSTSKQNTTGTTYEFTSSSTANTSYTINVDGYTKVSLTSSTKKAATALYYKTIAVPVTPTLTMSGVSPSTLKTGETVTINVERLNSTATISYQYSTDNSTWNSLTPASTSNSGQTATWVIPAITATTTYYFRAQMTDGGTKTTSSASVTAYGKKTIKVKNSNNWANLYIHHWGDNDADATTWPGTTTGISAYGSGQWKYVVIYSCYDGFILNANVSGDANQTADLNYSDYTDNKCYAIGTNSGKRTLSNTAVDCPAKPDVTTAAAGSFTNTVATLNASDVDANNDAITAYGFKWGTTTACSDTQAASNLSGTAFSYQLTGLTAGQTYYFKAYATNGQGTTYGDVKSFTVPYKVTITQPTGCSAMTPGTSTQYVKVGDAITATAATGYQFSSWTVANLTLSAPSTTSGVTTSTITAISADNGTITAVYNPINYTAANNLKNADGVNNGQYNVTYNATSIAHTTAPSKSGYNIAGYYKEAACTTLVANSSRTLQKSTTYTTSDGKWKYTSAPALYVKWTQALTLSGNGGSNGSITTTYYSRSISGYTRSSRTGYTLNGYYTATSGGNKVINADGSLVSYSSAVSSYLKNSSGEWIYNGTPSLSAQWSANTYTITLGAGTGGSGSGTASVKYDATALTSISASGITQTGYHISWWAVPSTTTKVLNGDGSFYANNVSGYITSGKWTKADNCTLNAWWEPNTYTVELDVDEAHKGTISGATTSQTVTFNAATVTVPNRPTAEQGYGLDGYYTGQNGEGTKLINGDGTWIASVSGYTDANKKWIHDGDVTLYAYYKKAEITGLTFKNNNVVVSPPVFPADANKITVTAALEPTPAGSTHIDWRMLHGNDNPLDDQPSFGTGTTTNQFALPAGASGTYKIEAVLRMGATAGEGTTLSTMVVQFQVAAEHTVTVLYKCGDETIKSSSTVTGKPLEWTEVVAHKIVGYSFSSWTAGDGITLRDTTAARLAQLQAADPTIVAVKRMKAIYDGKLTINYTPKRMIYFYNTLNWSNVYVYFYKNDSYWGDSNQGSGANTSWQLTNYPYGEGKHGKMSPVEPGSKIYYFDADSAGVNASYTNVVFTELNQHGCDYFYNNNKVVRRGDYNATTMPLFVPLSDQPEVKKNGNTASYYCEGYWMNYPANTGYTLRIYDTWNVDNGTGASREFLIPFSEDVKMPLKQEVEINFSGKSWFLIYRNDGKYLEGSHTFKQTDHGDKKITKAADAGSAKKMILLSDGSGIYTFNLSFRGDGGSPENYDYYLSVDFPAAVGDYRIVYKDNATWSNGAHGASWYHPSDIISKNKSATEAKEDIVSFFVSHGSSPSMKFQYISAINATTGAITWTDVTGGSITIPSSITAAGVYNFVVTQPAGGASISLVRAEPYTGNYYIRTDCAGETKWNNFRAPDHLMSYSEYSITHGGYSHYYTHWVQTGDKPNIKFCIANEYSSAISDTLTRETAEGAWANIGEFITEGGNIRRNANVRFMWNQSTNKVSRAYVDGAQGVGSNNFLYILSEDRNIRNADESSLVNNKVQFSDKENWIYEAYIQAKPNAAIKLLSNWGESNKITQYFKGSSSSTEKLIGGSGSDFNTIRVLYDFKTNRLIAALVPTSGNYESDNAIEADIMFIREHQGDVAQLTFGDAGKISKIETAYGVMRFNKWTMNNKSKEGAHSPLDNPASVYERSLFWISFPFKVKLSEVFGFGTYGEHWAVQRYDGADRAARGHFQENGSFWKWMNRSTEYLEPNQGYLLAIDADLLTEDGGMWPNNIQNLELFFPSYGKMPDITNASVTCTIPEHPCTINWAETKGLPDTGNPRTSYNRTIFDSHWNVISVPTYVNTDKASFANTTWTSTKPSFLYTWNSDDNTITARSATGFTFHAMHSYMVQYGGNITWTAKSGSPAIIARRTYADEPVTVEFNLELQQNEQMIDRAYVVLSEDEAVSAGFKFGEDMTKEFNASRSAIYTFIPDVAAVAGNTLPMSDQTTVVPVGVDIIAEGEYIISLPEGTSGVGVTLIDNELQTRTNLALTDYAVTLPVGTYDERFVLEISPIEQTTTGVGVINSANGDASLNGEKVTGVCKKLIDGVLYIVKDGKVFDARGARIQ